MYDAIAPTSVPMQMYPWMCIDQRQLRSQRKEVIAHNALNLTLSGLAACIDWQTARDWKF